MKSNSKDALGDRMKKHEYVTRVSLPCRTYTIIRLDGKAFHTFTRGCKKPFDRDLMDCMQATALKLCQDIQNAKFGYTQSDEITLILTDFDERNTSQWFDGNLQKIVSVAAAIATAEFNKQWLKNSVADMWSSSVEYPDVVHFIESTKSAHFDARAFTVSDPWEAYNQCYWRQMDASKNSIQMVARSLYSHKELQNANSAKLQEMIHEKGQNWNDYPIDCRRGAFIIRNLETRRWFVDREGPILSQDRDYFFSHVPLIEQYTPNKGV